MSFLRRALLVAVVGVVGWTVLVFVQVSSAADRAIDNRTLVFDEQSAVVVLGAAQYNGEPSPVLRSRLDTAFAVHGGLADAVIVTTGSNQPGDEFTEGFAGYAYLRERGVPEDELVVVVDGGDTWETMLAVAGQLGEGDRNVVLVTDPYHARRTAETAREVGLDPVVVAASDATSWSRRFRETGAVALGRLIGFRRLSILR